MQQAQALPGKKVALMVNAQDAPTLREKGQDFFQALRGKTIKPNDQVSFGGVMLWVEATKPKGSVRISETTKVKISIAKKELRPACPSCSHPAHQGEQACPQCGAVMPMVEV